MHRTHVASRAGSNHTLPNLPLPGGTYALPDAYNVESPAQLETR